MSDMMPVDAQKPMPHNDAALAEPGPLVAVPVSNDTSVEATEPTLSEPVKPEGEEIAPAGEKKEELVEPLNSGALGYKAPGLKNAFRFSKKYFWFGEEPVPASNLSHYMRGEKPEVAHPVVAWSSQTGKGLLFFVKHADEKSTPAGVLNLADATDLSKDGTIAFHFKLPSGKHTFEAQSSKERDGWFVAVEKAMEEAKASKTSIHSSEGYMEQLEKLAAPTAMVKEGSAPKKSTDFASKPVETEAAALEGPAPLARTGSSSSSSSDENKNKSKKAKSKSRSVSRGKRGSLFGGLLGKKDKAEETIEAKKEDKKEETEAKKEDTAAPVIPDHSAPVNNEADNKLMTHEETTSPVVAPSTEDKKAEEEKPKPTKRGSIFGNLVEKLRSPTHEKKETDLLPASAHPPKTEDTPHVLPLVPIEQPQAKTSRIEETPTAPAVDATPEAPKTDEAKPPTPQKEKQHFSFGKFLGGNKEKVRSPSAERASTSEAPKLEDPVKTAETSTVLPLAPVEQPIAEARKEEPKAEEAITGVTSTASATPATQDEKPKPVKRGSIFGNLTGSVKKEKDAEQSEKPRGGLGGLFRNASKVGKTKKEKEVTSPAKVGETTGAKEEKADAPVAEEKNDEVSALPAVASTEPSAIGDVTPDAVTVGQGTKSTAPVATSA